jgi:uncharacterized protein (DUF952 family)
MLIFHLARREDWVAAQGTGRYGGSSHDRSDGFIHFSTAETVSESAARHRAGETDLVLIAVDSKGLKGALRWEKARGGLLFPHLYGTLPIERVKWVKELPLGVDGRHVFPPLD